MRNCAPTAMAATKTARVSNRARRRRRRRVFFDGVLSGRLRPVRQLVALVAVVLGIRLLLGVVFIRSRRRRSVPRHGGAARSRCGLRRHGQRLPGESRARLPSHRQRLRGAAPSRAPARRDLVDGQQLREIFADGLRVGVNVRLGFSGHRFLMDGRCRFGKFGGSLRRVVVRSPGLGRIRNVPVSMRELDGRRLDNRGLHGRGLSSVGFSGGQPRCRGRCGGRRRCVRTGLKGLRRDHTLPWVARSFSRALISLRVSGRPAPPRASPEESSLLTGLTVAFHVLKSASVLPGPHAQAGAPSPVGPGADSAYTRLPTSVPLAFCISIACCRIPAAAT